MPGKGRAYRPMTEDELEGLARRLSKVEESRRPAIANEAFAEYARELVSRGTGYISERQQAVLDFVERQFSQAALVQGYRSLERTRTNGTTYTQWRGPSGRFVSFSEVLDEVEDFLD